MDTNKDLNELGRNLNEAFAQPVQILGNIVKNVSEEIMLNIFFGTEGLRTIIKYYELHTEKKELQNRIEEINRELEFLLKEGGG